MPKSYTDWVDKLRQFDGIIQVKVKGKWVQATKEQALAYIRYENRGREDPRNKYTVYVKKWLTLGNPEIMVVENNRTGSTREIRALTP